MNGSDNNECHLVSTTVLITEQLQAHRQNIPTLDSPISEHSKWICKHFYDSKYPDGSERDEHGAQHVTRAAKFGLVWANLRRRYGDQDALRLSAEDMKLIQIALLFHDSARLDDGEDFWDNESALNLYGYLTSTLGVSHEKAKALTEATANKDYYPDNPDEKYQKLVVGHENPILIDSLEKPKRTIAQKIIHDADCLDIHRVDIFDASYLDFYQEYCADDLSSIAARELNLILAETRQLLLQQGDLARMKDSACKAVYNKNSNYDTYDMHTRDLNDPYNTYMSLRILSAGDKLLEPSYLENVILDIIRPDPVVAETLTVENISSIMGHDSAPYLLFRGLDIPSTKPSNEKYASLASLEIQKILRPEKGNPVRSATLLPGATYTRAGLLLYVDEAEFADIQEVSERDIGSSRGKKYKVLSREMPHDKVREKLKDLSETARFGTASQLSEHNNKQKTSSTHNEILLTIRNQHVKGISYNCDFGLNLDDPSLDPSLFAHPDAGLLEAHFIQQVYQQQTGVLLPIFEISYYSNKTREVIPDDKKLIQAWKNVCREYIKKQLDMDDYAILVKLDCEQIKVRSLYAGLCVPIENQSQSPDYIYDVNLQAKLNEEISQLQLELLQEHAQQFTHFVEKYDPKQHSPESYLQECSENIGLDFRDFLLTLIDICSTTEDTQRLCDNLLRDYCQESLKDENSWLRENFDVRSNNFNRQTLPGDYYYSFIYNSAPTIELVL